MSHTPGPWKAEKNPMRDDGYFVRVDCPQEFYDGVISFDGPIPKPSKAIIAHQLPEGDARLIAAAPTMLTALENVIASFNDKECSCDGDCIDGRMVGYPSFYHRIEEEIKRAIAKATGEK